MSNNGKAIVDFDNGRGFGPMGRGLPENFLEGDKGQVLVTIAFLYSHPDPMRVNSYGQAVSQLALFAAGAQVELTKQQFRRLERKVKEYESIMRDPVYAQPFNEQLAAYARRKATGRAKKLGII